MAQNSTATVKRRGPGRPFKKGQSGNAGGRPKKNRDFEQALKVFILEGTDAETGTPRAVLLLEQLFSLAMTASEAAVRLAAVKELLDRTIGKVAQQHRVTVDDKRRMAEQIATQADVPIEEVEPMLERHLHLLLGPLRLPHRKLRPRHCGGGIERGE
jgi:hypothetical protein